MYIFFKKEKKNSDKKGGTKEYGSKSFMPLEYGTIHLNFMKVNDFYVLEVARNAKHTI